MSPPPGTAQGSTGGVRWGGAVGEAESLVVPTRASARRAGLVACEVLRERQPGPKPCGAMGGTVARQPGEVLANSHARNRPHETAVDSNGWLRAMSTPQSRAGPACGWGQLAAPEAKNRSGFSAGSRSVFLGHGV